MVSIQGTEPVQVLWTTQDVFDFNPPVVWDTSADVRFKKDSVKIGRVHVTWEWGVDGEHASVVLVAWKSTFDRSAYISDLYPTLCTLFEPLIGKTRPPVGSPT